MKNYFPKRDLNIFALLAFFVFSFLTFTNPYEAKSQTSADGYPALILQADKALAEKDYPAALLYYGKAKNIKPELKYASDKIAEINTTLDATTNSRSSLFENSIIKAESYYKQKDYPNAKAEYQKALVIDPSAQFPKDRLGQISAIFTDPDDLAYYSDAISNGDRSLASNDFEKAIAFYETALSVKPDAKVVKDKISNTKKLQSENKVRAEQSAKTIAAADKLLTAEKRTEARAEYEKALALTPENTHAKQKIQEIDRYLNDKKTLQDTYDKSIELADQFYINRDFVNARLKYQEALKSKPEARYPKEMLEKTKSGESQLLSDQEKYDAALSSAENLLKSADYEAALIGFKSALALKPSENYPRTKITELEKLISDRTSRKDAYDIAIKNGDQAFDEKKYDPALAHYRNALTLLPDEKYPAQKIEEITTLVNQRKALDESYKNAVAEADKQFNLNKLEESIALYTQASVIKPDETYPQQKITEAQGKLSSSKSNKEIYANAIATGNRLLAEFKYKEALDAYELSRSVFPFEGYPISKISEINFLLNKYDKEIEKGNKAFSVENYDLAIESFQDASVIKPSEQYPKDKITEAKTAIASKQKNAEKYTTALNTGDQLFASKEYERALVAYQEAVDIKTNEKYPAEQIARINKLLSDLHSADENYSKAIADAEISFNAKKYTEAIASYTSASKIKPAETYPKSQVEKTNGLVAEQKKADADYLMAITSADKFLAAKKYDEAIVDYRKALEIKSSEKYPADKIIETEKLIADQKTLEESYSKAIADGDKYLSNKDYLNSLASFKNAGSIKPSETYPKQKITEVQAILDKDKAEGQRYQEAIAQADKLYADQNYSQALDPYLRASNIRPSEKYPQDQIAMVNQKLAGQKRLDDDYQKLISDGAIQLTAGKYNEARVLYSNAVTLKPAEKLPKDKIAEIDGLLADLQNKEQSFGNHIKDGDAYFAEKKYTEAITSYSSAGKIKPSESYPKSQIEKINLLIAEQKKLDADYLTAITSADKLLAVKKYDEAIADYRKALVLKPMEKYPAEKIAEAEKQISDLKALEETYSKSIADGDKYLSDKDYMSALASFKNAGSVKPAEAYPKQKITEVQSILDKDKAEGQRYQEAIAQADKLFSDKKYSEALAPYQLATSIKPAEKYPLEQVSKINQMLADQKKLDDDYQKLIKDGAAQLNAGKYAEARTLYTEAGLLKPSEKLPKDVIAEIDGIVSDIKNKDQSYAKYINEGDAFFAGKQFAEAITSYTSAALVKPAETYPKSQIEKINNLLTENKKLEESYNTLVVSADVLYDRKKYSEAILEYRNALTLKPTEKYPLGKIADSEKQIADLKAIEDAYSKGIADGDRKLAEKDYPNALAAFKIANTAKPDEVYPRQKIAEIQTIQDKSKAENERYQEAIVLADNFFTGKKYREALEPYQRASTIKPGEKYPQEQILRINQLLAEQKKLDDDYQDLISQAEVQLKAEKYDVARNLFTNAASLKPTEILPKNKIAEIDGILASIKLKDENYTKAINAAAELYAAKNLAGAIKSYEEAQILKPAEKFPSERITAIKAELAAINDRYLKAIALGDTKLASKNMMEALNAYQNALEIKPGEVYPESKIAEINKALSAQKADQDKMYASYINEGDKSFESKDYSGAKSAFTKAAGIKPAETYPKQRITEITKIIEEIMLARKAEYNKALGEADKLYNTKIFDQAIDAYETAAKINPEDSYPQQQINKIRQYMADHSIKDLFAQTLIIAEGNEKKFTFTEIEPRLRKNNYILLKARSTGKSAPKVYLNYGKDNQKNGGIVLRSIDKTTISDYLIRISVQDKWYREDNNWISLFVETGDIEITKVQIAAGE